eukprot:SAG31_NODE_1672_length_7564_cov_10.193704_9_plen_201_part_00
MRRADGGAPVDGSRPWPAGVALLLTEHADEGSAELHERNGKGCYFLVFVQLFEKYGTLIERNTALIEKVPPCSATAPWMPRSARRCGTVGTQLRRLRQLCHLGHPHFLTRCRCQSVRVGIPASASHRCLYCLVGGGCCLRRVAKPVVATMDLLILSIEPPTTKATLGAHCASYTANLPQASRSPSGIRPPSSTRTTLGIL